MRSDTHMGPDHFGKTARNSFTRLASIRICRASSGKHLRDCALDQLAYCEAPVGVSRRAIPDAPLDVQHAAFHVHLAAGRGASLGHT
jgi:hypothetical protein